MIEPLNKSENGWLTIGKYSLINAGDGKIHIENGVDGGHFSEDKLEKAIQEFYDREF